MKNTLAIGMILLGGALVYSGFKNWTIAETLKFFAGQGAPASDYVPMTEEERQNLTDLTHANGDAPGATKGPPPSGTGLDVPFEALGIPNPWK